MVDEKIERDGASLGRRPIFGSAMVRVPIRLAPEHSDLLGRIAVMSGLSPVPNVSAGIRFLTDAWAGGPLPESDIEATLETPRTTVTLTEEHKGRLFRLGGGSFSKGVRRLITNVEQGWRPGGIRVV